MTLILTSQHAEMIGGRMVEPGEKFDPKGVDSKVIDRLKAEKKVREVKAASKKGGDS